jgi:2-iminobutanoate/2-iminopropanoate deaminase
MLHRAVSPTDAPAPVAPYSPAVVHDKLGLVFVSGQVALDPATGELVGGDVAAETTQVLKNLRAVLEAAGSGMDRVLKVNVYLTSMGDFAAVNEVYATFFPGVKPARAAVQVGALPLGVRVEIEATATL